MPCICVIDRERPKYQVKEDADPSGNGPQALGDTSDTVKVTRNLMEETIQSRWVFLSTICGAVLIVWVDFLFNVDSLWDVWLSWDGSLTH